MNITDFVLNWILKWIIFRPESMKKMNFQNRLARASQGRNNSPRCCGKMPYDRNCNSKKRGPMSQKISKFWGKYFHFLAWQVPKAQPIFALKLAFLVILGQILAFLVHLMPSLTKMKSLDEFPEWKNQKCLLLSVKITNLGSETAVFAYKCPFLVKY